MKTLKLSVLVVLFLFATMQIPALSQAQTLATAQINYAGSNSAASWVNVTIPPGGTTTYNFILPSTMANQMLAMALTAISSGKNVQIQYTGGNWSSLASMMLNQ